MRVPDKLLITVELDGKSTEGLLILLKFLTATKNPFDFVFGPSNSQGKIEVSRDEILREAGKTIDLFPMDHWNIEVDWNGVLRVTPMNRKALARALSALGLFRSYDYGPGYEDSLRAADAILTTKIGAELTATVQFDAEISVTIEIVSVLAA